jgi:hypothetical protein
MGEHDPHQTQPGANEETGFRKALKATLNFLCILNMLLGASAVILGIHDLLLATRAAERAIGAVFLLGGALLFGSAIAVLRSDNKETRGWALPGFVFGMIPGITLALIQFGGYGYSASVWFWLLAVLIPAASAVMVGLVGVQLGSLVGASSVTLIAAAIALLPPLLGSAFVPVVDTSIVDAQVDMKVIGRRGDMAVIDAKLTIKNVGKRRLVFIGSMYSVQAVKSKHRQSQSELHEPWRMESELNSQNWSARFESPWVEGITATEVGYDFVEPGNILEPGQHHVETMLTLVPCKKFNTAEMYAIIVTAYDDKLRLGDVVSKQKPTDETLIESTWDIDQNSWAVWLAHGSQDVMVRYNMDFVGPRFTGLYIDFRAGRESQKQQQILEEYNPRIFTTYGLGSTTAYRSISLDEAAS